MAEQFVVDSANLVEIIYRTGVPGQADPAEDYFEASKIYPSSVQWDMPGAQALEYSHELRIMSMRSARRYASRPIVDLPEPAPLTGGLADALAARRSAEAFGAGEVDLAVLSGLLRRTYGVTGWLGNRALRATPSGGALYPLDVFVVAHRVPALRTAGLYHFDPFRDLLADLGDVDLTALGASVNPPELAASAAVTVVLSASFWRSRFKYGQRALRFALMEAGHLAQNLLLVATGYGLAARPLGGFLDAQVTKLLPDHNGVDDAPIYVLLLGTPAA